MDLFDYFRSAAQARGLDDVSDVDIVLIGTNEEGFFECDWQEESFVAESFEEMEELVLKYAHEIYDGQPKILIFNLCKSVYIS